jgi:hypothetical protein
MMGPAVNVCRHPELVSGSISPLAPSGCVARWMLKRVQHDVGNNLPPYFRRPSAGWGLSRLSAKWFAQRHEGIKKLLLVFVSSCEPKTYRVRQYETMGSRFRGNDNVGAFGCVNGCARHPELVCACPPAAPGSISPLAPSVSVARWMLKRVQHDVGGNVSLRPLRLCVNSYFRRPSVGWGLSRLSSKHNAKRPSAIGSSLRWSDGVCGGVN